jgi:hypothetical protein
LSVIDVTLVLGAQTRLSREQKMNEASIIIMMGLAGFLWAVAAYTVGVKEGERKGYARGRAVGRHASSREVTQ